MMEKNNNGAHDVHEIYFIARNGEERILQSDITDTEELRERIEYWSEEYGQITTILSRLKK